MEVVSESGAVKVKRMPKYTKEEKEQRRAKRAEKKKQAEEAYRRKYGITLEEGDYMILEDRTHEPPIIDAMVPVDYIGLYGLSQDFAVVLRYGDDYITVPHNKQENLFFDSDTGKAAYEM